MGSTVHEATIKAAFPSCPKVIVIRRTQIPSKMANLRSTPFLSASATAILLLCSVEFLLANPLFGHQQVQQQGGEEEQLHPVFLFHGFTGSKTFTSGQNIEYPAGHKCQQKATPFHQSWISSVKLVRNKDCEFYWMGLEYDETTGTFSDHPGVEISFQDQGKQFGDLDSMQCLWLNYTHYCSIPYYRPLIKWLNQLGYTEGQNLFGAVYDWRHHPSSVKLDPFYEQLKALIEQSVEKSGGKRAHLVAHSYGNIIVNHFLRQWTNEEWQQKYIESTVNVAPPFGGSSFTTHQMLTGYEIGFAHVKLLPGEIVRDFVRSIASPAILLPRTEAFNASQVFVQIDGFKEYTMGKMREFLELTNTAHLWEFHEGQLITDNGQIPMHCIYGTDQRTPMKIRFNSKEELEKGHKPASVEYGDGDGTVNIESLRMCQQWKEQGNDKITVTEVPGYDHQQVLGSKELTDGVLKPLLLGQPDQQGELFATDHASALVIMESQHSQQTLMDKNPQLLTHHPSSAAADKLVCLSEHKLAKCPAGTMAKRWTHKSVKFVCFEDESQVGTLLARLESAKSEEEFDRLIWETKRGQNGNGPKMAEMREQLVKVPLTCA